MWEQIGVMIIEQKNELINLFLMAVAHIAVNLMIQNEILRRKHSSACLFIYAVGKAVVLDLFFYIVLHDVIQQYAAAYLCFLLLKVVLSIIFFPLWMYTYDADFLKCFLYCVASEVPTVVFSGISMSLAERIDGNMKSLYHAPVGRGIIIFLFFYFLIFFSLRFLVRRFFKKWLNWLRDREIKHKLFWKIMIVCFFLMDIISLTAGRADDAERLAAMYRLSVVLIVIVILSVGLLGIWIYRNYQKQVRQRNEFLKVWQKLITFHMKTVRQQILDMEYEQQMINQQMEKIQGVRSEELADGKIKKYLDDLKNQYRGIQAGIYSDDIFVDSVLCYYADILKRRKTAMEVSFQKYQKGCLEEIYAGKILMSLMETALEDTEETGSRLVKICGASIQNQVIFWMECDWGKGKSGHVLRAIKHTARECRGSMKIKKQQERLQIEMITMGNRSRGEYTNEDRNMR